MSKHLLAAGCGLVSLCISMAAHAAEAPAPAAAAAPAEAPASAEELPADIIVTGSARAERRFDVSYAVNSLSGDQIEKIAPRNFADLLGTVPGIHIEGTGGEVQNITRVRGIPTDRGYLIFQQDGLELFHEIDGVFFNSGEGMNRLDLMTDRVEIVRGGPAPIYASNAAAVANIITVTGSDRSKGKAELTIGDSGLYRLDAVQSGPLGKDTYYAIGGFIRQHDGYRDNGFPNDKGGQIRANIKHDFDNGWVKLSVNYVNDHNVFYLPIPISDPRNPAVSLDPYIDYFTGTMNSPALRNVNIKYRDGAGVLQSMNRDLANGRYIRFGNVGLQYEGTFDDWTVSFKTGFTTGKNSFDAFYSTTNPADGTTFANSYLSASQAAFGAVTRMGYTIAGTTTAYDPYAASGLVMSGQYRAVESSFHSWQGDLSVTRKLETGLGTHDLKLGAHGAIYGETSLQAYQDYLIEVAGKPRTLDLVAYSATGQALGYVTDKGVLRYTTTLNQGETDAKMLAVYANDTWEIVPGLRLDAGIRHQWYAYDGFALLSNTANLGDPATLADNATRAFTGAVNTLNYKPTATNWTAGLNYDFNDHFGAYGRVSNLEVPPQATAALSTAPTLITTKAKQYELGLKASFGPNYLYVTGFYTKFDPLNASFVAFNPVTGRNDQVVPFIGQAVAKGIELDGMVVPAPWFSLSGSLTIADPQYRNLQNSAGADPSAVNGKQIVREPKIYGSIRPAFNFAAGGAEVELYGRYEYVGRRFVDFFNQTAMPAYGTLAAGLTVKYDSWKLQVIGDNLTNAHGLTEGNTRTDALSGQGTKEAIYGRPIFGRNVRFVVSKSW